MWLDLVSEIRMPIYNTPLPVPVIIDLTFIALLVL